MKRMPIFLVLIPLLFAGGTANWPAGWTELEERQSVGIVDAAHYCVSTLGYDFGLTVEAGDGEYVIDGDYSGAYAGQDHFVPQFDNTITISNANRDSFDWRSHQNAINAVVVHGERLENIFYFVPPAWTATRLYPNTSDTTNAVGQISRISFCWRGSGEDGQGSCYQDESAWAANDDASGEIRYTKGNWATYVAYKGEEEIVTLFAERTRPVGMAILSAPLDGEVTITIHLNEGYFFYYDLEDALGDNNLKVQGYKKVPNEEPDLNLFEWVKMIPVGSRTGAITVPEVKFYGIHIDLAKKIPCG
jgi:hypothetical protein